jgi:heme A synthase
MGKLITVTIAAAVVNLGLGRTSPGPFHYTFAAMVGLLTVVLVVLAFRGADRSLRRPALAALGLILLQGAYGALATRVHLPAVVFAVVVLNSMLYLLALVYLAFCVHAAGAGAPTRPGGEHIEDPPTAARGLVLGAGVVLLLQVGLGTAMRHAGAGAACGTDLVLCDGRVWPAAWPEALHQTHRILGWLLFLALGGAHVSAMRAARGLGRPAALHLARLAPLLVGAQVGLGLWGVATWTSAHVIAAHLAVAGILVANLGALYLALGPLGARLHSPRGTGATIEPAAPGAEGAATAGA